jgi:death-on-curing protein
MGKPCAEPCFYRRQQANCFRLPYTFLAINGFRLMAEADQTWIFIVSLYEANEFGCEKLVLWLRDNVKEEAPGK